VISFSPVANVLYLGVGRHETCMLLAIVQPGARTDNRANLGVSRHINRNDRSPQKKKENIRPVLRFFLQSFTASTRDPAAFLAYTSE
jgi:hypothetical protein